MSSYFLYNLLQIRGQFLGTGRVLIQLKIVLMRIDDLRLIDNAAIAHLGDNEF